MPKAGDKFRTNTYQKWGEYSPKRFSPSRSYEPDESYIVIPKFFAEIFSIYMSNKRDANTCYEAYDDKGEFICVLKAQGCSTKGDIFAKQFAGKGNLKALNPWILKNGVTDADTIEVEFLSSAALKLSKV